MTAELAPIRDADLAAVADFLTTHHDDRAPWSQSCSSEPWRVTAPNHGFLLRDGARVVGALLALYSERMVAGRLERFCNMGTWCVLPEFRSQSITLVKALLAQEDYHFTVLSPNAGPQEILAWLKFRFFDTSAVLVPNLPWPTVPGRTTIGSDPELIERTLVGSELELYRDHAQALAIEHLVIIRGQQSCYVMFREYRYRDVTGYAEILHVSDPGLFRRALMPLTRHLLVHRGLVATLAELRTIEHKPGLAFTLTNRPKMYRSADLDPGQIDYLYSELACVPW
jgi:hypothetical protein